jgi:hypothetical protein
MEKRAQGYSATYVGKSTPGDKQNKRRPSNPPEITLPVNSYCKERNGNREGNMILNITGLAFGSQFAEKRLYVQRIFS